MKSKLMIHLFGGINGSNSFHWWESMEFGGFGKKKKKKLDQLVIEDLQCPFV